MDEEKIKRFVGKKVFIVLNNNLQFTIQMPQTIESTFSAKDKFGEDTEIDCDYIAFIKEIRK